MCMGDFFKKESLIKELEHFRIKLTHLVEMARLLQKWWLYTSLGGRLCEVLGCLGTLLSSSYLCSGPWSPTHSYAASFTVFLLWVAHPLPKYRLPTHTGAAVQ